MAEELKRKEKMQTKLAPGEIYRGREISLLVSGAIFYVSSFSVYNSTNR
jgi:hypothetical protein